MDMLNNKERLKKAEKVFFKLTTYFKKPQLYCLVFLINEVRENTIPTSEHFNFLHIFLMMHIRHFGLLFYISKIFVTIEA